MYVVITTKADMDHYRGSMSPVATGPFHVKELAEEYASANEGKQTKSFVLKLPNVHPSHEQYTLLKLNYKSGRISLHGLYDNQKEAAKTSEIMAERIIKEHPNYNLYNAMDARGNATIYFDDDDDYDIDANAYIDIYCLKLQTSSTTTNELVA